MAVETVVVGPIESGTQTDDITSLMPLTFVLENFRRTVPAPPPPTSPPPPTTPPPVAVPAQVAVPAPAQRPQAGNGMNYFNMLGNIMGRWSKVDIHWNRSSKSGQRYMRRIPRFTGDDEMSKLTLAAHAQYWVRQFLVERNLDRKLILSNMPERAQFLFQMQINLKGLHQIPERTLFYQMKHERRPPPTPTANTRFYFHGTFVHTMWTICESEQFVDSVNGSAEGHEASTPGLYASEAWYNSIAHYGWPCNLFNDGMLYRMGFVIQVEHNKRRGHEKLRNTLKHEIVFPSQDVYILGLCVLPDAEVEFGWARFYEFELDKESWPLAAAAGRPVPHPRKVATQSPCRFLDKWAYA